MIPKDRLICVNVAIHTGQSTRHKYSFNVRWCDRRELFVAGDGTMFGERAVQSWSEPTDVNTYVRVG